MTRVCFFVGPSAPAEEFAQACGRIDADVEVLRPIQRGDLLRVADHPPDVIGIVDGYFFQVPAVLHKEILLMLDRGVRVLGAASLGALRAVELDSFGMEGIGEVYRLYRGGRIDGDDEVAVLHTHDFRPLSEPMVNIRHNLRRAVRRGILPATEASRLLKHTKAVHFSARSYQAIVAVTECSALSDFLRHAAVDLKREDALKLVRTIGDRLSGLADWPTPTPAPVNTSIYLHLFERQYVGRDGVPDVLALAVHKFSSATVERLVHRVRRRCLSVDEALRRGLLAVDTNSLLTRFRSRRRLAREVDFNRWLDERCMSAKELGLSLQQRDLVARLGQRPLPVDTDTAVWMRPGIPWDLPLLREVKLRREFRSAVCQAHAMRRAAACVSASLPGLVESLDAQRLERFAAQRWGIAPADFEAALGRRGFNSYGEFGEVARLAYVYEHFGDIQPRAGCGCIAQRSTWRCMGPAGDCGPL